MVFTDGNVACVNSEPVGMIEKPRSPGRCHERCAFADCGPFWY
jgi:hypothetical protein